MKYNNIPNASFHTYYIQYSIFYQYFLRIFLDFSNQNSKTVFIAMALVQFPDVKTFVKTFAQADQRTTGR